MKKTGIAIILIVGAIFGAIIYAAYGSTIKNVIEHDILNTDPEPITNPVPKPDNASANNVSGPPTPRPEPVDDEAEYRSHWIFFHCYFEDTNLCIY